MNYADESTVQSLLAQLAAAEHSAHRWGHDDALNGLRGITADALDDVGRGQEAQLLRTQGRHVLVTPEGIRPGRFTHEGVFRANRDLYGHILELALDDYPLPETDVVGPGLNEGFYRPEDTIDPAGFRAPVAPGHLRVVDTDPTGMDLHHFEDVPYPDLGRALAHRAESHMSIFDPFDEGSPDIDMEAADARLNELMAGLQNAPFEEEDPEFHYERVPANYADESTLQSLLAQLASAEHSAHRWGHDDALQGFRGIVADALDDVGRSREAQLLRTQGRHVLVTPEGVRPGRFNDQELLGAADAVMDHVRRWSEGYYGPDAGELIGGQLAAGTPPDRVPEAVADFIEAELGDEPVYWDEQHGHGGFSPHDRIITERPSRILRSRLERLRSGPFEEEDPEFQYESTLYAQPGMGARPKDDWSRIGLNLGTDTLDPDGLPAPAQSPGPFGNPDDSHWDRTWDQTGALGTDSFQMPGPGPFGATDDPYWQPSAEQDFESARILPPGDPQREDPTDLGFPPPYDVVYPRANPVNFPQARPANPSHMPQMADEDFYNHLIHKGLQDEGHVYDEAQRRLYPANRSERPLESHPTAPVGREGKPGPWDWAKPWTWAKEYPEEKQYEEEEDPEMYGTREALEAAIAHNPLDIDPHLELADWHREFGNEPEADFRHAVGGSVQRRLQNPFVPAALWRDPNETLWIDERTGTGPQLRAQVAERHHGAPNYYPGVFAPGFGQGSGEFTDGANWRWQILDSETSPLDFPAPGAPKIGPQQSLEDAAYQLGISPDDPEFSAIYDWWVANEANLQWSQPLNSAHRWFAGIDDPKALDPDLWPNIENLMRRAGQQGMRFEDQEAPLEYGWDEDRAGFLNEVQQPFDPFGHQKFANSSTPTHYDFGDTDVTESYADHLGHTYYADVPPRMLTGESILPRLRKRKKGGYEYEEDEDALDYDWDDGSQFPPLFARGYSSIPGFKAVAHMFPKERSGEWTWNVGQVDPHDENVHGPWDQLPEASEIYSQKLTPSHLWGYDLPGGEPPPAPEQDWMHGQDVPPEFHYERTEYADDVNTDEWAQIVNLMRQRKRELGRFEDDDEPTEYDDEAGFRSAIQANPIELTSHGAYADWLRDQERFEDADFRNAVVDSFGRRLNWGPAQRLDAPAGFLDQTDTFGWDAPYQLHTWADQVHLGGRPQEGLWGRILRPQQRWDERANPRGAWRWAVSEQAQMTPDELAEHLRAGNGDFDWDYLHDVPPFLGRNSTPLHGEERLAAGIDPLAQLEDDARLRRHYPEFERLLRGRFDRKQRFEDDDEPIEYGYGATPPHKQFNVQDVLAQVAAGHYPQAPIQSPHSDVPIGTIWDEPYDPTQELQPGMIEPNWDVPTGYAEQIPWRTEPDAEPPNYAENPRFAPRESPEYRALTARLITHPADRTARLALIDLLNEQGRAREAEDHAALVNEYLRGSYADFAWPDRPSQRAVVERTLKTAHESPQALPTQWMDWQQGMDPPQDPPSSYAALPRDGYGHISGVMQPVSDNQFLHGHFGPKQHMRYTAYGDREALEGAIAENPWEGTIHGELADWHDEFANPQEAGFRRKVMGWLPERVRFGANPTPHLAGNGSWLFGPYEDQPLQKRTWQEGGRWGRTATLQPRFDAGSTTTPIWGRISSANHPHSVQMADYFGIPIEDASNMWTVERALPGFSDDLHVERELNEGERAYLGLNHLDPDTDPGIWPQIEAILRERHRLGQRFEDDDEPTEYGELSSGKAREILHDGTVHGHKSTDKQRRFFGAISSGEPPHRYADHTDADFHAAMDQANGDLTHVGAYADWLEEQGRPRTAARLRRLLEGNGGWYGQFAFDPRTDPAMEPGQFGVTGGTESGPWVRLVQRSASDPSRMFFWGHDYRPSDPFPYPSAHGEVSPLVTEGAVPSATAKHQFIDYLEQYYPDLLRPEPEPTEPPETPHSYSDTYIPQYSGGMDGLRHPLFYPPCDNPEEPLQYDPLDYGLADDEAGFRQAIEADPYDLNNHLAFADWLEEQGQSDNAQFRKNMAHWIETKGSGGLNGRWRMPWSHPQYPEDGWPRGVAEHEITQWDWSPHGDEGTVVSDTEDGLEYFPADPTHADVNWRSLPDDREHGGPFFEWQTYPNMEDALYIAWLRGRGARI